MLGLLSRPLSSLPDPTTREAPNRDLQRDRGATSGPHPSRPSETTPVISGRPTPQLSSALQPASQVVRPPRFSLARRKPGLRSLISTSSEHRRLSPPVPGRVKARTLRLVAASPREVPMGAVLFWLGIGLAIALVLLAARAPTAEPGAGDITLDPAATSP